MPNGTASFRFREDASMESDRRHREQCATSTYGESDGEGDGRGDSDSEGEAMLPVLQLQEG